MVIDTKIHETPASTQTSAKIAMKLAKLAIGSPREIWGAFGGAREFFSTIHDCEALDRQQEQSGSRDVIRASAGLKPDELISEFNNVCVGRWLANRRPSLPALAVSLLREIPIETDDGVLEETINPLSRRSWKKLHPNEQKIMNAILLVAARAEMIHGQPPSKVSVDSKNGYHDSAHTGHVATATAFLAAKNEELKKSGKASSSLCITDRLLLILAAFGHDVDHPGKSNPKDNKTANEDASFKAILPILRACGLYEETIDDLEAMFKTTSPNGPHEFLKKTEREWREGLKHERPSAENAKLSRLQDDRGLTEMAAILSDADLFASAGAGVESGKAMSLRFNAEEHKAGGTIDYTTAAAHLYFLKNIVGEDGFTSDAGRACFNQSFKDHLNFKIKQAEALKNNPA